MDCRLSRRCEKEKGNRQGHFKASEHFKVYINPLFPALNNSELGFNVGPLCITFVCVVDNTFVQTNSNSSLQSCVYIVSHYGKCYQLKFNA